MELHPTRNAIDLTLAALVLLGVGFMADKVAIVAWGGGILLGLQIARAVTLFSVARVRASGFEMVWRERGRCAQAGKEETIRLTAEVRNRDAGAARYVALRVMHSPHLNVEIDPVSGEVPAGGRLAVEVKVVGQRVGRHGLFGLSLEVQGSPGLYEVPLTFSNPFGVEVLPGAYPSYARSARGGRGRQSIDTGRAGKRRGGNSELRELREYAFGDPFKRIAWKASARRGTLMVKDYDVEERDVTWVFLDASVELWAGATGAAPLDWAIERAGWLIAEHQRRGDPTGLAILGARRLAWLLPGTGPAHTVKLLEALAFASANYASDRSTFDESDAALRVLEHLRMLEPELAASLHSRQVDRIARRAVVALRRAPFRCPQPYASSPRLQALFHYLESFGIDSPPRLEPDRPKTDRVLVAALKEVAALRPRPSLIYVCSPAPDPAQQSELLTGLRALGRGYTDVRWIPVPLEQGVTLGDGAREQAVRYAVELRAQTARASGQAELKKAGIHVEALHAKTRRSKFQGSPAAAEELAQQEEPTQQREAGHG